MQKDIKMRRINKWLLILFITLIFTGCGLKHTVLVDSITSQEFNPNIKNSRYILLALDENKTNDLYYEKFYGEVKDIFSRNGNTVVDNIQDADYIAFINYTNKSHKRTVTESIPITGQTGVDTHTIFRQGSYGYVSPYTYTTPRYGTVGYSNYQHQEVMYTHSISVMACEKTADSRPGKKLWQLIAVTSNDSNDIRKNFYPLLFILEKYMMKDTNGHLDVDIYENDNKLMFEDERFHRENNDE